MLTTLDRLAFGRAIPTGGYVDDDAWTAFEKEEIAPHFPEGFTVVCADGAWRDQSTGWIIHEPSILLDVAHDGSAASNASIRAIARAYKERFHQDAVMRITQPISVQFI